jgi:hypothetical protein
MIVCGSMASRRSIGRQLPVLMLGLSLVVQGGCSQCKKAKTGPVSISYPPGTSIAVAPPINASGCPDIDPVKVADLMASELSSFPGIGVIGVNRVLAVLAEQGMTQITSADHALAVCDRLGADAIVVFAVTEYNPYTPVVGMVAEIYGREQTGTAVDPVAESRMARPLPMPPQSTGVHPWAQVQRTFNAEHKAIQEEVEEYADARDANKTPYGWRRYLASQEYYLRYCCYSMARDLVH